MGAKFSSGGGATVFYDDGPITAPSGEQGTQRTEFEAAIKSVTSSTTVGAVFVYDTRNDSDGGAWRKKTSHTSWAREAASDTRSARSEFPSVALIVADNDSSDRNISIYDLDDPSMVLWAKFEASGGLASDSKLLSGDTDCNAVFALNGRIYTAHDNTQGRGGLRVINFVDDECVLHNTNATYGRFDGTISQRNSELAYRADTSVNHIANEQANDVAATIVEGSEVGALGLPIPTIAVATNGGVSVIHPNGSVYDIAGTGQTHDDIHDVFFTDDGMVGYNFEASSSVTHSWSVALRKIPFADETIGGYATATNLERYNPIVNGNVSGLITQASEYNTSNSATNAVTPTGKNGLAIGYGDRLSIVKRNPANMEEGAVAYIASDYNTGYMLGDIRFAGLANSSTADRSVKSNTLTANGTITESAVATNAEAKAYSGFSASNYLSRAYDADFDFGTGDFSIAVWAKWDGSTTQFFADRSAATGARLLLFTDGTSGKPKLYLTDGSSITAIETTNAYNDGNWHQIVAFRRSSTLYIYVDGKDGQTTHVSSTIDVSNSSATLTVGVRYTATIPFGGSLSLLRISATAPTPQQVKDIYEAEAPLFRAGAKCLLQGNSNVVNALGYDTSTNLLHAGTGAATGEEGVTVFKGLEAVDTFKGQDVVGVYNNPNNLTGWVANSIRKIGVAGGVSAYGRTDGSVGGVIVDLPAIDVRGDINTADSKLPDDGKLHFTGVTSDGSSASPVTIGHIPIAEGECVTITAKVRGNEYNDVDGEYCYYEVSHSFYRDLGDNIDSPTSTLGDVIARTATITVSDESTASMEFVLEPAPLTGGPLATTGIPNKHRTVRLKCTGVANKRLQWNAEVEVQRISEKQYER